MSLTNYLYLVEWDDFKKVYEQNRNSGFIGEAIEIEANWLSKPEIVEMYFSPLKQLLQNAQSKQKGILVLTA